MARVGNIFIGGSETTPNVTQIFESGICFFLESKCKEDSVISFENNRWEVEVKSDQRNIVARCHDVLTIDEIVSKGFNLCQEALDLLSVDRKGELQIKAPGVEHILLFKEGSSYILREVSLSDIRMSSSATVTVRDQHGNIVPQPPQPVVTWNPAFRFYRLSQASNDLFKAYRNLFLGLESLLNQICPKSRGEKEKQWLLRAIRTVSRRVPLTDYVPVGTIDPVEYFIRSQYDNIRCKLFHAKGHHIILPHQNVNPTLVVNAYEILIKFWRQIAMVYFNVCGGGGAITYLGFKSMMDGVCAQGFSIHATDDPTPPNDNDTEVSPMNKSVWDYEQPEYRGETRPGNVLLIGSLAVPYLRQVTLVHRICSKVNGILFAVSYLEDGLYPTGTDRLESYHTMRLINTGMPKTIF